MRSNLVEAVLAARVSAAGQAPRRGSVDLVWGRLASFERAQLEREARVLEGRGVRAAWHAGTPLFHTGAVELLRRRMVAIVGGREARPDLVALAERAAVVVVRGGAAVLSGDTEGVEAAALGSAARLGGSTVAVLSEGFRRAGTPSTVAATAVVTPSAPGREWSIDTAMARNDTIAGLSSALVAVGASSTGATLDAGMRALAAGRPVLAVGSTPGSRLLVDYGAVAAIDDIEVSWWLENRLAELRAAAPGPRSAPGPAVAPGSAVAPGPASGPAPAPAGRVMAGATAPGRLASGRAGCGRGERTDRVDPSWRPQAARWSTA